MIARAILPSSPYVAVFLVPRMSDADGAAMVQGQEEVVDPGLRLSTTIRKCAMDESCDR
jgi:hypothetical protein